ncbi:MAG: tetratricopeptide repeat protein [Archangium sp.]|nr:tetratricopeptide repeat protein [Archangium sp.]
MKEEEYLAVLAVFPRSPREGRTCVGLRRDYDLGLCSTAAGPARVAVTRCKQGNKHSQSAATEMIEDLAPRFVLVVGIAGGIPSEDFTLGDVIVSSSIIDVSIEDTGTRERRYNASTPDLHITAVRIVERLPALLATVKWPKLKSLKPGVGGKCTTRDGAWNKSIKAAFDSHVLRKRSKVIIRAGGIASSDRLVKDPELMKLWRKVIKGIDAKEMESAGALAACSPRGVPYLTIRGISDIIGWKREEAWTRFACTTAAVATRMLVKTGAFAALDASEPQPPAPVAPVAPVDPDRPRPAAAGQANGAQRKVMRIHRLPIPAKFVGRQAELKRLAETIASGFDPIEKRNISLITFHAPGGMGKSTFVNHLIESDVWRKRFDQVIWFSFYERATRDIETFLTSVGAILGCDSSAWFTRGADRDVQLRRARTQVGDALERQRTMLVLDGLETTQTLGDERSAHHGEIAVSHGEVLGLLDQICSQSHALGVLTTRVPVKGFTSRSGHLEVELAELDPEGAASLLRSLGVGGTEEELLECAAHFRGHPLCLRAAGLYMARHRISARSLELLVGDPAIFSASTEGERLSRIVTASRDELSEEQRHFLQMLCIPLRPMTESDLHILVPTISSRTANERARIRKEITDPLIERGFIDTFEGPDGRPRFTAHALMKLAFSTWFDQGGSRQAHLIWARAAVASPDDVFIYGVNDPETLERIVFAIECYLGADDFETAWEIYDGRGVHQALHERGSLRQQRDLTHRFELAFSCHDWNANADVRLGVYHCLAHTHYHLDNSNDSARRYSELALAVAREQDIGLDGGGPAVRLVQLALFDGRVNEGARLLEEFEQEFPFELLFVGVRIDLLIHQGRYEDALKLAASATGTESLDFLVARAHEGLGNLDEAERILKAITRKDRDSVRLRAKVLSRIAIRRGNLAEALKFDAEHRLVKESLGVKAKESVQLLILEGRNQEAMELAQRAPSRTPAEQTARALDLAACFIATGKLRQAREQLGAADEFMRASGYYRPKEFSERLRARLLPGA